MKKKQKSDKKTFKQKLPIILLAGALLLALTHTSVYIQSTPEGLSPGSGLATGRLDWIKDQYTQMPQSTKIILGAEWLLVIIITLVSLIRGRMKLNKELNKVNVTERSKFNKTKPETDIDILYEMLQKDKTLRINAIGKIFGVDNKTVLEWCRILESCDFAEIRYPTVGDPKIILIEEKVDENKK